MRSFTLGFLLLLAGLSSQSFGLDLKEYFALTRYSPPRDPFASPLFGWMERLNRSNQYSLTVSNTGGLDLTKVRFNVNRGAACSGTSFSLDLSQTVTLADGIYTSTAASNFALCSALPDGCGNTGQGALTYSWLKMKFFMTAGTVDGTCFQDQVQASGDVACSNASDCGFSTTLNDVMDGTQCQSRTLLCLNAGTCVPSPAGGQCLCPTCWIGSDCGTPDPDCADRSVEGTP